MKNANCSDVSPRHVVFANPSSPYADASARHFRCLGWEVHRVDTGLEARRLAGLLRPDVVILDTGLEGESGWLTCAKLTSEKPDQRVILVGQDRDGKAARMAEFVGAEAHVHRDDGVPALIEEVYWTTRLSQTA